MHARNKGFTLIELMIVVVVISILAGIAAPTYIKYTTRTRRAAGAGCLMEQAQFMERFNTTNMTYVGGPAALPQGGCVTDLASYYTFAPTGAVTGTTFTLAATPVGTQLARDTECGTMSIDQAGRKSVTGTTTASRCF